MPRQVERGGERVADDAGDLRRRMQRERVAARLVFGQIRARLDRHRGVAAHPERGADPDRRCGERRIDVAALELSRDHHVGAGFVVQQRTAARGRGWIRNGGKRLEIDLDQSAASSAR